MKLPQLQTDETKIPLRRVLGLGTAVLLVAGNIIGTGVFKKIVPMAATGLSATEILLAWVAAGIVALTGALTFAGLAKLTTRSEDCTNTCGWHLENLRHLF